MQVGYQEMLTVVLGFALAPVGMFASEFLEFRHQDKARSRVNYDS